MEIPCYGSKVSSNSFGEFVTILTEPMNFAFSDPHQVFARYNNPMKNIEVVFTLRTLSSALLS
jgi:hypothetical protein